MEEPSTILRIEIRSPRKSLPPPSPGLRLSPVEGHSHGSQGGKDASVMHTNLLSRVPGKVTCWWHSAARSLAGIAWESSWLLSAAGCQVLENCACSRSLVPGNPHTASARNRGNLCITGARHDAGVCRENTHPRPGSENPFFLQCLTMLNMMLAGKRKGVSPYFPKRDSEG